MIGMYGVFITPVTLIIGIIKAIKSEGKDSKFYTGLAIISAYLIAIPLIYNSLYS
jgi:hypothetical protein